MQNKRSKNVMYCLSLSLRDSTQKQRTKKKRAEFFVFYNFHIKKSRPFFSIFFVYVSLVKTARKKIHSCFKTVIFICLKVNTIIHICFFSFSNILLSLTGDTTQSPQFYTIYSQRHEFRVNLLSIIQNLVFTSNFMIYGILQIWITRLSKKIRG